MEKLTGVIVAGGANTILFLIGATCVYIDQRIPGMIALTASGWFAGQIAEALAYSADEPDDETILDAIEDR